MNGAERCTICGKADGIEHAGESHAFLTQAKWHGTRWEYQAVVIEGDALGVMNTMGNDGWELISVIGRAQRPSGVCDIWLAKRQKTLLHSGLVT
jgi:hypothetical protein